MSYLVLARKWRPLTFDQMVGQEFISRTLRNAVRSNRVAHAFLFTGSRGVGKTTTARILAKCLNCDQGPTEEPCNQCSSCLEITEGRSLDVYEIDGASNTSVDDIRELRENIKYLPRAGKRRIYIIDEVHMLSKSAFNALLKTLEEPPEHVVFAFATTESHKVPETIQSRCQRFDFRRIPRSKILGRLQEMASAEGIQIQDTALGWIAKAADGSMRDAQGLFDQIISYCGTSAPDDVVMEILGIAGRGLFFKLSEAVLNQDAGGCMEVLTEVNRAGYDISQFYQDLVEHFRNLLIVRIMSDPSSVLDMAEGEFEDLRKQAVQASPEDLRRIVSLLLKAEGDVLRSSFPQMGLEILLIKVAQLSRLEPLEKILEKISALEQSGRTGPLPVSSRGSYEGSPKRIEKKPFRPTTIAVKDGSSAVVKPYSPPPQPEIKGPPPSSEGGEEAIRERPVPSSTKPVISWQTPEAWPSFINALRQEREVLATLLESVERWEIDSTAVKVFCPGGSFFYEKLQQIDEKAFLTRIARECFGPSFGFLVCPVETEKGPVENTPRSKPPENISPVESSPHIEEARKNPVVQTALELFDGAITDVKTLGEKPSKPDE